VRAGLGALTAPEGAQEPTLDLGALECARGYLSHRALSLEFGPRGGELRPVESAAFYHGVASFCMCQGPIWNQLVTLSDRELGPRSFGKSCSALGKLSSRARCTRIGAGVVEL
jgi:hypothetical protein